MVDAGKTPFDFSAHEKVSVAEYLKRHDFYGDLATVVSRIIEECLNRREIKVHSVQHRAKDPSSFGRKASIPSETDSNSPKYPRPLEQITDLAGVRVIAHFPATLSAIDQLLNDEFEIIERSDKSEELLEEERFGYQSVHYLVRIKHERSHLAEYNRFAASIAEVQVRTILQHAWAEIEHDIQYKSANAIPAEIRRRFMALAGMLEIADREFQEIQDANKELEAKAIRSVRKDELLGVEITPQSLKAFLEKRLGPDGRISDWNYDWTVRLLKRLGFRDLLQIERAVSRFNDDQLSNLAWGARQGQIARFELMLLAALGERYLERHPWRGQSWIDERNQEFLKRFKASGIPVGEFDPLSQTATL